LLPHFSVICLSFSRDWYGSILPHQLTLDHYAVALANRLTVPAIQNSLLYASLSTCIDLFVGIAVAYLVTRTRIAGRFWLDAFAMLPLAVPGIVLAIGYLAITRRGSIRRVRDTGWHPLLLL